MNAPSGRKPTHEDHFSSIAHCGLLICPCHLKSTFFPSLPFLCKRGLPSLPRHLAKNKLFRMCAISQRLDARRNSERLQSHGRWCDAANGTCMLQLTNIFTDKSMELCIRWRHHSTVVITGSLAVPHACNVCCFYIFGILVTFLRLITMV